LRPKPKIYPQVYRAFSILRSLTLACFLLVVQNLIAQEYSFYWGCLLEGKHWKIINAVESDAWGNIIIAGAFEEEININGTKYRSLYRRSLFLCSIDSAANTNWINIYDSPGISTIIGMEESTEGGFILTGSFEDSLLFGENTLAAPGRNNIFLLEINGEGE